MIGKGVSNQIMKCFESHLKEFVYSFVCHGENIFFFKFLGSLIAISDSNVHSYMDGLRCRQGNW